MDNFSQELENNIIRKKVLITSDPMNLLSKKALKCKPVLVY
jgi:hypothetical protein